jgi:hypothetical protein
MARPTARDFALKGTMMPNETSKSPFDPGALFAGAAQWQRQLFEMAQSNTQRSMDFARDMLGVRSPDEALRIVQEYMTAQTQANQQAIKALMEAMQPPDKTG